MAVFKFNLEHRVWQGLFDNTFHGYGIFAGLFEEWARTGGCLVVATRAIVLFGTVIALTGPVIVPILGQIVSPVF